MHAACTRQVEGLPWSLPPNVTSAIVAFVVLVQPAQLALRELVRMEADDNLPFWHEPHLEAWFIESY